MPAFEFLAITLHSLFYRVFSSYKVGRKVSSTIFKVQNLKMTLLLFYNNYFSSYMPYHDRTDLKHKK